VYNIVHDRQTQESSMHLVMIAEVFIKVDNLVGLQTIIVFLDSRGPKN